MGAFVFRIGRFAFLKKGTYNIKGADGYWKQLWRFAWYIKERKKK